MRAERLTVEELAEAARMQQVASLDDVRGRSSSPAVRSIIPRA